MPLSDTSDPIVREVLRIRNETHGEVKRLYVITAALFVLLVVAIGATLVLRSRDLASSTRKASTEQVRTCFRSSQARSELRLIARDKSLSESVRGFVQEVYENTPTVNDCKKLADVLHIPIPRKYE